MNKSIIHPRLKIGREINQKMLPNKLLWLLRSLHGFLPLMPVKIKILISNYNISLANPEQLSQKMVMNEVYGLNQIELQSFISKIEQVNLSQVNQAARELLHADKIVVVTAGPPILIHRNIKEAL